MHQGSWHGDVAIKILNMENTDDDATLEAFRLDVSTFRKTRHENLILFMGACMNPPKLAIVTSLCKGEQATALSQVTCNTNLLLMHRRYTVHPTSPAQGQVSHEQAYHHSPADHAGYGLPPSSWYCTQGLKDQEYLLGARTSYHR